MLRKRKIRIKNNLDVNDLEIRNYLDVNVYKRKFQINII